jgi:parallel beta-helix repeat protein
VTINKALRVVATAAVVTGDNTRTRGIVVSASDVTVDGFTVVNIQNAAQTGAIDASGVSRFTLMNSVVRDSAGACVSISGGSGHQVLNSEFSYCAQEGYHLAGVTDTLFAGNRIHHNNPTDAYDPGWEAGGGKASNVARLTFSGNESYANHGPGLWCDINCASTTFSGNRVHDNQGAGIFYEISSGAIVTGNVVWGNGWSFSTWGWGAGILISSSSDSQVYGNVVAWNADGISVISQNRGSTTWNDVHGNFVHDNTVIATTGTGLGWFQDWSGVMFNATSNNRGSGGDYWYSTGEPSSCRYEWQGCVDRISTFNTTPGEEGGTYLSSSQRDAILQSAGVPLTSSH